VETRQLGSADRIEARLSIDTVVAWRIFHLTKLGRETPEVPCTGFFEQAEWKALSCLTRQEPTPPDQPPSLREAIRIVAGLGGFLGRNGDGKPGTKSHWLGIQRLDNIAATWKFMALKFAPHLLTPPVSSNPGYGYKLGLGRGLSLRISPHGRSGRCHGLAREAPLSVGKPTAGLPARRRRSRRSPPAAQRED
jgi:hypothetical protein